MKKLVFLTFHALLLLLQIDIAKSQSCNPANPIIISSSNGNTSSAYFDQSTWNGVVSGNVIIVDDFLIDSQFTFDNADVYIEPNVSIIVGTSLFDVYSLTVTNGSKLMACSPTEMWEGINTIHGNNAINITDISTIQDAKVGIRIINGTTAGTNVYIYKATFNRNYRHIHKTGPYHSTASFEILKSSFICTNSSGQPANALLSPYSSPAQRTETAILINLAYSVANHHLIGDALNGNVFSNTEKAAIEIDNSTATVIGNEITNPINQYSDYGIHVSLDAQIKADGNQIRNCETGVFINDNVNLYRMEGNEIFDCKIGINNFENDGSNSGFILSNKIRNDVTTGTLTIGITNTGSNGDISINDNTITDAGNYISLV